MRIATALGFPGVRHLKQVLSPREWDELTAYYEAEPFGEFAADVRAAKLAAVSEPNVSVEEFLKTPGERRIEDEGGTPLDDGERTDAAFAVLMGRQIAEEADRAKG